MNLYHVMLYLISTLIYMFAIKQFMGVFFEKRQTSSIVMWATYFLYFILATVERFVFNTALTHMLFVIPILFIITFNHESSVLKRLAVTISNYAVFTVAVNIAFKPALHLFQEETTIVAYTYALGSVLSFIITILFRRFKTIKKNEAATPMLWVLALTIPGMVLIIMIFEIMGYNEIAPSFGMFALYGVNIFIFFVYEKISQAHDNKQKLALYAQENEYYQAQCKLMQEAVDNIKSLRHDMKFHLATAREFTANNKTNEATAYLDSLLGSIEENEIYSNTKNTAFDSIINFKLNNAKQENIKPDIRLLIPPALNIEVADVVTIIGNLLDNALDAVSYIEEKIIKLDIEYSRECLFIKIDNTFDGVIKYAKGTEGADSHIVTRKEGGEHGRGFMNIRKSVEKYNGHIDINYDERIFSVGVLLYVTNNK